MKLVQEMVAQVQLGEEEDLMVGLVPSLEHVGPTNAERIRAVIVKPIIGTMGLDWGTRGGNK